MSRFAELPNEERDPFIQETAAQLDVVPLIVEKDYLGVPDSGSHFRHPRCGTAHHAACIFSERPCFQALRPVVVTR